MLCINCVLVGALWNGFKPSTKIFLLTVPRRCFFCGSFMLFLSCFLLCFRGHLFIDDLWSPAGNRQTSWLSFVMSNSEIVTLPLAFWVRCGAWLYRFLIQVLFLTMLLFVCVSVYFPHVAMDWSVVCNCDISLSYSLILQSDIHIFLNVYFMIKNECYHFKYRSRSL